MTDYPPPPPGWTPQHGGYPQQPPQPWQPPPRLKKKHTGRNIVLSVVGAIVVIIVISSVAAAAGKKATPAASVGVIAATTSAHASPSPHSSAAAPKTTASIPPLAVPGTSAGIAVGGSGGTHTIVYAVTSNSTIGDVTYLAGSENGTAEKQLSDQPSPWTLTLKIQGVIPLTSLVAQEGDAGTSIACRIIIDGKIVDQKSASGQYSVVTCSGS